MSCLYSGVLLVEDIHLLNINFGNRKVKRSKAKQKEEVCLSNIEFEQTRGELVG